MYDNATCLYQTGVSVIDAVIAIRAICSIWHMRLSRSISVAAHEIVHKAIRHASVYDVDIFDIIITNVAVFYRLR